MYNKYRMHIKFTIIRRFAVLRAVLLLAVLVYLLLVLTISGCSKPVSSNKLRIAEQFGLAYAPLQLVKELKLIEKNLPGAEIEWRQMGNTASIREAMVADEIDAGFMAIPPFLIGWDKGMKWKIATGLSASPVGLVVNRPDIKSLKDLTPTDKIAVPQPGSVQHILLAMACERELGDAKKLDNQLVTLAHPDGMNALISGKEIAAHFTSPPYLIRELEMAGMYQILDGKVAMGTEFTFIVGVTSEGFYTKKSKAYEAFVKSVEEAIKFINTDINSAAAILSKAYGMEEKELIKQLAWEGTGYSTAVHGIDQFAAFMKKTGYISKVPAGSNEIMWKDVNHDK